MIYFMHWVVNIICMQSLYKTAPMKNMKENSLIFSLSDFYNIIDYYFYKKGDSNG